MFSFVDYQGNKRHVIRVGKIARILNYFGMGEYIRIGKDIYYSINKGKI